MYFVIHRVKETIKVVQIRVFNVYNNYKYIRKTIWHRRFSSNLVWSKFTFI